MILKLLKNYFVREQGYFNSKDANRECNNENTFCFAFRTWNQVNYFTEKTTKLTPLDQYQII
jgi:hypothetical protein